MKFKIKKSTLKKDLDILSKSFLSNNILPILDFTKIIVNDGKMIMLSSGAFTALVKENNIVDSKDGSCLINSKDLYNYISSVNGEYVYFGTNDNNNCIIIKCGKSKISLNSQNVNNYPKIDMTMSKNKIAINGLILKRLIDKVSHCCSTNESRIILTGINLSCKDKFLKLTACDSYRLSYAKINIDSECEFDITVPQIFFTKCLGLINKDKDLDLYIGDRKIQLANDNYILQERLIDGSYPDTNRLIPNSFDYEVKNINTRYINDILKTMSILSSIDHTIIISMDIKKNELKIETKENEKGYVSEVYDKDYEYIGTDDGLKLYFDCSYLMQTIKSIKDVEKIDINLNGALKPFMIKTKIEEIENVQILLPIITY